jgi:HK97 family phage portal protein
MQNAIVYRSVRMVAEAAASIPLLLYQGDEEIEAHPLIDLIRQPSLDHTGIDFLESWYGFLLVAGNAYVEAVALDGVIRELHVLRPDRMKVIPGLDGWPAGYEYTAGGRSVRFIDEPVAGVRPILHVRMFHPANDHYGMSPIEAAAVAIDIHNTAASWNKALLDNSARPSGALVYNAANGQMTDEQFARLKSELETTYQGAKHAGRPLLLEGGLDWKPLSLSPKDMDFIEAKNSAAREIALALGVPPQLLGLAFSLAACAAGRQHVFELRRSASCAFWRQTVLPLVNRTARALSLWLGAAAPTAAFGGRLDEGESPKAKERLEFRADLDQVEAFTPEREALWARLNAASFLTEDEKRAAAGYGEKENSGPFTPKYSLDQPRVPAGNSDGGQWTDGGGGGSDSFSGGGGDDRLGSGNSEFSPDRSGWHDYQAGPNQACNPSSDCSASEIADYASRYAYPGQDPSRPVEDRGRYVVYFPGTRIPAGLIETRVSSDGLTVTNVTRPLHVLYSGQVERTFRRTPDGTWQVVTHGNGNNIIPGMNALNRLFGPEIFDEIDQQLRSGIDRHHGRRE